MTIARSAGPSRRAFGRFPPAVPGVLALTLIASICLTACTRPGDGALAGRSDRGTSAPTDQEASVGTPRLGPDGQLVRTVQIRVGGVPAEVEIADTDALRQRGLMHREALPENHGMLFVYADAAVRSFWMRNTEIPLDIAFIDGNGYVVNIEQMEPHTDRNYYSQGPMMYALEMELGWFEKNGVGPGDRLEF